MSVLISGLQPRDDLHLTSDYISWMIFVTLACLVTFLLYLGSGNCFHKIPDPVEIALFRIFMVHISGCKVWWATYISRMRLQFVEGKTSMIFSWKLRLYISHFLKHIAS